MFPNINVWSRHQLNAEMENNTTKQVRSVYVLSRLLSSMVIIVYPATYPSIGIKRREFVLAAKTVKFSTLSKPNVLTALKTNQCQRE
jgi:hypothetical protein